jgi:hypothetical protein
MPDYEIKLTLDVEPDANPQARIFIDTDLRGDLTSEMEVALRHEAAGSWSARFSAASGRFMYRVAMLAEPGSIWSLSIASLGERGEELLFDSDEVTLPKEWLVGSCEDSRTLPVQLRELSGTPVTL